jgi:hypothetical protein
MQSIILIVCTQQADAENRRGWLEAQGYVVTVENVTDFIGYDAHQYGGGKKDDPTGKWLVTGRKGAGA